MWQTIWIVLGAMLLFLLLANWCGIIGFAIDRYRHPEKAGGFTFAPPFLGGVIGCIGCLVCPIAGVRPFAWVPLLLDPSILLTVVVWAAHLVWRGLSSPTVDRQAPK